VTIDDWIKIAEIVGVQIVGLGTWLVHLGNRVTSIETKIDVFWKGVSFDAAKILHSPNPLHRRMDELVERYIDGSLNATELSELVLLLETKRDSPDVPKGDRMTAAVMLRAIEQRYPLNLRMPEGLRKMQRHE